MPEHLSAGGLIEIQRSEENLSSLNAMNYYRRYIGDYQRDTMHLSVAEHGAFTLLLDAYYAQNGQLPRHLSELNRLCRATTKIEKNAVQSVAQQFFPTNGDGSRHNKRADSELAIALPAIEKMREAGKKSGKVRRGEE